MIGTVLAEPPPFRGVLCTTRSVPGGVGFHVDGHQCAGTLSVANLVHDGYQLDVSARVSWVRVADPLGERNEGLPRGFVFSTASYFTEKRQFFRCKPKNAREPIGATRSLS